MAALRRYEALVLDNPGPPPEEAGWKLVTGDAFRSPPGSKTLAVQANATDTYTLPCLPPACAPHLPAPCVQQVFKGLLA